MDLCAGDVEWIVNSLQLVSTNRFTAYKHAGQILETHKNQFHPHVAAMPIKRSYKIIHITIFNQPKHLRPISHLALSTATNQNSSQAKWSGPPGKKPASTTCSATRTGTRPSPTLCPPGEPWQLYPPLLPSPPPYPHPANTIRITSTPPSPNDATRSLPPALRS